MFSRLVTTSYQDRLPSEFTWATVNVVFIYMKPIMNSLLASQTGASKSILSSWLHSLVNLYISLSSEDRDAAADYIMSLGDRLDAQEISRLVEMKNRLRRSVLESLKDILNPFSKREESMCHYWLCLIIDPRFKLLEELQDLQEIDEDFRVKESVEFYEDCLYRAMKACYLQMHPTSIQSNEGNRSNVRRRDFAHHRNRRRQQDRIKTLCKQEYLSFRDLEPIDPSRCPLHWFATYRGTFPTLAAVARHILAIPSSQSSVERLFSVCGHILSARRNRLKIDSLNMLVNISTNVPNDMRIVSFDDFIEQEIEELDDIDFDLSDIDCDL